MEHLMVKEPTKLKKAGFMKVTLLMAKLKEKENWLQSKKLSMKVTLNKGSSNKHNNLLLEGVIYRTYRKRLHGN